jgi:hypothetical protein
LIKGAKKFLKRNYLKKEVKDNLSKRANKLKTRHQASDLTHKQASVSTLKSDALSKESKLGKLISDMNYKTSTPYLQPVSNSKNLPSLGHELLN